MNGVDHETAKAQDVFARSPFIDITYIQPFDEEKWKRNVKNWPELTFTFKIFSLFSVWRNPTCREVETVQGFAWIWQGFEVPPANQESPSN